MCSKIVVLFTTSLALTDTNGLTKNIVIFTTCPKFLHKTAKPSRFQAITFICSDRRKIVLIPQARVFITCSF